uniref:PID domain-containing protein n=1 Tax=Acanthochromis polyacanthus TaxID=80966 RepID=A0A3Q1HXY4_9TELE
MKQLVIACVTEKGRTRLQIVELLEYIQMVTMTISQLFCLSTEACPALSSSTVPTEEDSVQFNKLSYLGCTWVKAPRNEAEAQRAMATLRAESAIPIPITLHVPCGPDGSVRIVDQASGTEIASFPIYKVLFCARGREGSVESDCFSFTESYRSSEDFQIHVFSCHIKEAWSERKPDFFTSSWILFSGFRNLACDRRL